MATKAKAAKGTKLQRGDGATSETFITVGEVTTFNGPNKTAPTIEASSFDSTAEEFVLGLPSNGEVQFEMNFVGTDVQQQGLREDMDNGTQRNFKLVLADHSTSPTTFAFSAIVSALSLQGQGVGAIYKASCTLKITGAVTPTYRPS